MKALLLVGHDKVPCDLGLRTGGPGGYTQLMVLGTKGSLPAKYRLLGRTRSYQRHRLLFFPKILTPDWPDWAKGVGGGRIVCVCGCFKGLWDFN